MEDSVSRNLEEVAATERDAGEHFVTALVLDIPDDGPHAEMKSCGHPPPLLVRERQVTKLPSRHPAPPLGTGALSAPVLRTDRFAFTPGDCLVLCTDGVIEARSPTGAFYPLAERVASFPVAGPDSLLRHIHRDLLVHTGGQLNDDIALLIIERVPAPPPAPPTPQRPSGRGTCRYASARNAAVNGTRAEHPPRSSDADPCVHTPAARMNILSPRRLRCGEHPPTRYACHMRCAEPSMVAAGQASGVRRTGPAVPRWLAGTSGECSQGCATSRFARCEGVARADRPDSVPR